MRNGKFTVAVAALIALAVSLPSMAGQNGAAGTGQRMQRLIAADTNGDGQITFAEAQAAFPKLTQERFNKLDRNHDGVLSREDIALSSGQAGGKRAQLLQQLVAADTNGDGQVTFAEAQAAFPKLTQERFAKLDKNGDGVLSMADRRQGGNGKLGQRLKQADTNGDGKLSFDEAKAAFPKLTQERFNQLDRNQDGFLSKEDRPAAAK